MKAVLVIDMPDICAMCPMCVSGFDEEGEEDLECTITNTETYGKRPSWCPLSHPLKRVDSDFYIYDRKYLFDNLDREIDLLKGTKAFEEFMKAREEE